MTEPARNGREPRVVTPVASSWPRHLVVVSHVTHYEHAGRLSAFGAYAREIDRWAALFERVTIAAPCRRESPPGDALLFEAPNISIRVLRETGGHTLGSKFRQLAALPGLVLSLVRAMRAADAVHVRCPGNLGLLGAILAPLCSSRLVAKYAGQWGPYPGEPRTERLQRWILRSRWWRGPVTVYGDWPGQPRHVVPFFTSVLTRRQLEGARGSMGRRQRVGPTSVLFVGRLEPVKNVDVLLAALGRLAAAGHDFRAQIVGDGSARAALEAQSEALGLRGRVTFRGALPLEAVLECYETADILSLASEAEGWPKAIAEGMAFGLVCIGSDRGLVPQLLAEGRGIVVPPRNVEALATALAEVLSAPEAFDSMRQHAARWAQAHSIEDLQRRIAELLAEWWRLPPPPPGEKVAGLPKPTPRLGVLHLIDTLEAGGAERVAVNLVNALPRGEFRPHLGTTRREGPLAELVHPDVGRLRLGRRWRWDLAAIRRLIRYCRDEQIAVIHAHETSIFIAAIVAHFRPYPAIVWHDHFGRVDIEERPAWIYRLLTRRAAAIIAVNRPLASWSRQSLRQDAARVHEIPNFVAAPEVATAPLSLSGCPGSRIVCVANLRAEKDHGTLIRAMREVVRTHPEAHLLLVGGSRSETVRSALQSSIRELGLDSNVSLLGDRRDVGAILRASDIGVLSSRSEGFPLALLEYGLAGLPTVATRVGQCAEILEEGRAGWLVPPAEPAALAEAISTLLDDPSRRSALGSALRAHVQACYGQEQIIARIAEIYRKTWRECAPTPEYAHA